MGAAHEIDPSPIEIEVRTYDPVVTVDAE